MIESSNLYLILFVAFRVSKLDVRECSKISKLRLHNPLDKHSKEYDDTPRNPNFWIYFGLNRNLLLCSLLHNHKLLRKDLYRNCGCKTYLEDSPNPPHSNFKIVNNKLYGKGMKWSLYWVWGSHAFLNVFERQTSKKPWHPLIAYFSGRVKINLCYLLVKSAFSEQYLLKQFPPLGQSQSSKHSPLI